AMPPCRWDLGEMEAWLVAEAAPQLSLAENTAVIGIAEHGLVVRDGAARAELVHGDHEAEAAARPEHGHDRADGRVHVAHVLENGEGVGEIESADLEVLVHFFGETLADGDGLPAVELAGDPDVGGGD